MSEEYGPDFVSVTDDEGNEFELEHIIISVSYHLKRELLC